MKTKYAFVKYWNKHKFKIIVTCSIVFILILYILQGRRTEGTWSLHYDYNPYKKQPRFSKESKGQEECRRVLESLFQVPFPTVRPEFLKNPRTGRLLEIDCCNLDLGLGVEYNGIQHYQYIKRMHSSYEDFLYQQERDKIKSDLCEQSGFTLITVPYTIHIRSIENFIIHKLREHGYNV